MWSAEIKDLKNLYQTFKGQHPKLDKELDKLIATDDENMALVYSRRCLEVMITDLCETELNRPRGTEPLRGIIDRLNKEEKVPHNIVVSMQNLNSLSTFGAHPKDFDPRQVKPVLLDLITVLEWYLKHLDSRAPDMEDSDQNTGVSTEPPVSKKDPKKSRKNVIIFFGSAVVCIIIVVVLIMFDVIDTGKKSLKETIGSIVVLPFSNFTGTDTLDWLIDGMHSTLIGDMGKIGNLRTIGSTSSKMYENVDMSVTQIASELNVEGALEIDLVCFGEDSICWQVRLIKAGDEEKQLWMQNFKEDRSKILNLYPRITRQIADEISIEITPQELRLLTEDKMVNKEAYDAFLKGQYYWEKIEPEFMVKPLEYFELAIKKDPEWADPYAGLASVWGSRRSVSFVSASEGLHKAYKYLDKALEIDPNSAQAHYVKALFAVWKEWDWEKGEKEFIKTLELNPNHSLARLYYAHLLMIIRRTDEALHQANLGLELDPMRPLVLGLYGMVMTDIGDYPTAISVFKKSKTIAPDFRFSFNVLPALYLNGDYEDWIKTWDEKVRWNDDAKESVVNAFYEKGHIAAVEEMFKMNDKYGDGIGNARMTSSLKAQRSMYLNEIEKALDYLERMCDEGVTNATYVGTELYYFSQLKDNPRYIELLIKMNLPLPEGEK